MGVEAVVDVMSRLLFMWRPAALWHVRRYRGSFRASKEIEAGPFGQVRILREVILKGN